MKMLQNYVIALNVGTSLCDVEAGGGWEGNVTNLSRRVINPRKGIHIVYRG